MLDFLGTHVIHSLKDGELVCAKLELEHIQLTFHFITVFKKESVDRMVINHFANEVGKSIEESFEEE